MAARKVSLDRPVTTIGRSSMNDLPISDKMLSRQHARIVRDYGRRTDGRRPRFAQRDLPQRRPARDDPASEARRPDHGGRRDAQGRVRVHDARTDRRRRRGPSRQHDPEGFRRAPAGARHGDGPAAPGGAARQAHRVAAGRQRAHGRAPAGHLGRRAPRLPHGQGLRDAEARPRPGAAAVASDGRAGAGRRARGRGHLGRGHPALEDARRRRRREAQRPPPHGHVDRLGRLAGGLDPSLGHQVRAGRASRERGRGRGPDLRRLPRRPPLLRGSGPAPADVARERRGGQDPERAPHGRERREAADGPRVRTGPRDPAAPPARGAAAAAGLRAPRLERRLETGLRRLLRFPAAPRRQDLRDDRRRLRQGRRAGAAHGVAPGLLPRLGGRGRARWRR